MWDLKSSILCWMLWYSIWTHWSNFKNNWDKCWCTSNSCIVSKHNCVILACHSTEIRNDLSRCWWTYNGCTVSGLGSVIPATDRLDVEIQVNIIIIIPWPGGTIHEFLDDILFIPDQIIYFSFIGIVTPHSYGYLPPHDISANHVTCSQILLPNKTLGLLCPG